ncbi:MAG: hypothetical protein R3F11_14530 [Verrucomicrobiales bacterium]
MWDSEVTRLWDLASGEMVKVLHAQGGVAEFSADGRRLVTGSHVANYLLKSDLGGWSNALLAAR